MRARPIVAQDGARLQHRRRKHRVPIGVAGAVHEWCRPLFTRRVQLGLRARQQRRRSALLEPKASRHHRKRRRDVEHVLGGIVVHFARRPDVVVGGGYLQLLGREPRGRLVAGPGEVVAVVIEADVSILARRVAPARIGAHLAHPAHDAPRHLGVLLGAEGGVRIKIRLEKLGVIIGHLLEMGHDPLRVHAVAMEPTAELIVYAAAAHALQRAIDDGPQIVALLVPPLAEQTLDSGGMGKLGLAPEPPMYRIEHAQHQVGGLREERRG